MAEIWAQADSIDDKKAMAQLKGEYNAPDPRAWDEYQRQYSGDLGDEQENESDWDDSDKNAKALLL